MFSITISNLLSYFTCLLLIFSYATVINGIADITVDDARCWSQVFSVPKQGFKIFNLMQPVPCPNLFRPAILIPVSQLQTCMPFSLIKKLCPAHGGFYHTNQMAYTKVYANPNGAEAASSWISLENQYYNEDNTWYSWYKFCSIEVNGKPHVGVIMSTGSSIYGKHKLAAWNVNFGGDYFVKAC
jgi:hypothetical protein